MSEPMTVLYAHPATQGWATVTLFARLAARLLEATLIEVPRTRPYSRPRKAAAMLPRHRGTGQVLVIAATPGDLLALVRPAHWLPGARRVSGYVIDSFWDDRIPRFARGHGHLDDLFITDAELVDSWHRATGAQTHWLPFGTDVMAVGDVGGTRPVDLQRVGRQPTSWEDDRASRDRCTECGITFGGRPPFATDPVANQATLADAMRRAKFTLSFSNKVSPADYTHPTREYLTGRWLDALANGATVAGIAPRCRATDELLWPEALLQFPGTDPDEGLAIVAGAVRDWDPSQARLNHLRSLERVDWRWRVATLAKVLDRATPTLAAELAALRARIVAERNWRPG